MAKILYVSYDGMTDNLGQSQVIPYLKGLSGLGHEFWLISFEKPDRYDTGKLAVLEQLGNHNITWIPLRYTSKPPVLATVKDIWVLLKTVKKLHGEHNFDIVHCRSYIAAFAGVLLKRKFGVKFVFDMRGFWPDERVDGNVWNLNNPVYKFIYNYFKRQEYKYLKTANYTISLTENGKNVLHKKSELTNIPLAVIPCCADFDHFCPVAESYTGNALKAKLGITDRDFIVSYLGSVGTWYMLPEMLDFFEVLLKHRSNAKFLFITAEPPELILVEARKRSLPETAFIIVRATRDEVPGYISLSSVSLFFIKPLFSKKASSPTKLAEIMGMGIPVICNSNVGDVDEIINESKAGIIVEDFTAANYETAVSKIEELLKIPPATIRDEAIKRFSLTEGVARYHKVYETILK